MCVPLEGTHPASPPGPGPHYTVEETEAGGGNRELPCPGHPGSLNPPNNFILTDVPHFADRTNEALVQGPQPVRGRARISAGRPAPWDLTPGLSLQSWAPLPCARWASGVRSIHCPLRWAWSQQPWPWAGYPCSRSWGLKAPRLVFNKEDEFAWKPGLGGGGKRGCRPWLSLSLWERSGGLARRPLSAGGPGCGGAPPWAWRELALRGLSSLPRKPTGYCSAFVCLVTQLLVIEKFHRSERGRPADPSSRDSPIFQKIRD